MRWSVIETLCEVCEADIAVGKCRICGRYACAKHLGNDGICSICREVMCEICNRRLSITTCLICGRLICKNCSVELQPAIRVCSECYNKLLTDVRYGIYLEYLSRYVRHLKKNLR